MECRGQNITTVLDPDLVYILLAKLKFDQQPRSMSISTILALRLAIYMFDCFRHLVNFYVCSYHPIFVCNHSHDRLLLANDRLVLANL